MSQPCHVQPFAPWGGFFFSLVKRRNHRCTNMGGTAIWDKIGRTFGFFSAHDDDMKGYTYDTSQRSIIRTFTTDLVYICHYLDKGSRYHLMNSFEAYAVVFAGAGQSINEI